MKWLLSIALTLAACGKSSDRTAGSNPPAPAAPPATAPAVATPTGPQDRCEIHVTGAQTVDIIGVKQRGAPDGKVTAGTEYWLTDDEIRDALATFVRIGGDKPSKDEVARKVEEGMKKDPRLWLLMINCGTDDGFLNLSASNSSRSSDVPFGPHSYVINSDGKAGEFGGMFAITRGERTGYRLAAPGKLEITKFDATGITGTFGFEAATYDKKQRVTVAGSFDFGCAGRKCK
jgi:hypothetical protein